MKKSHAVILIEHGACRAIFVKVGSKNVWRTREVWADVLQTEYIVFVAVIPL